MYFRVSHCLCSSVITSIFAFAFFFPFSPLADEGITYRVQILAGHNDVSDNWVAKKYDFNGRSDTEIHEGWIKYTTGSFLDYESARNERESINSTHNFPEPFVTAYYLGERISVSEALVISHQDWLQ